MKHSFYKDGNKFLLNTGESPKGFEKVLFVVWSGGIDNLKEDIRTTDQLEKLEKINEVPDEWLDAFAAAAHITLPKPKAKAPKPAPTRRQQTNVFVDHLAAETDLVSAAVDSRLFETQEVQETQVDDTFHLCVVVGCMAISFFVCMGFMFCL